MNEDDDDTKEVDSERGRIPAASNAHGEAVDERRRSFLSRHATGATLGALALGYGSLTAVAGRYLYPTSDRDRDAWLFVSETLAFEVGDALEFESPDGQRAVVARRGNTGGAEDFVALSSVCPHLGCIVHWESHENRFFCPCHNGVFTPEGKGVGGPPGKAGQSLPRYDLKVERDLLFIRMPPRTLRRRGEEHAARAGHDDCLRARPRGRLVESKRLVKG